MKEHKYFGEILKEEGKITDEMIQKALELQKDNPTRKLGEILVTLNYITYDDITDTLLKQYESKGEPPQDLEEWLSQEEIDKILKKLSKEMNK